MRVLADASTQAQIILVYDPDGVTQGKNQVTDAKGRDWACLHYWRNLLDVSLRFRGRLAGSRALVCVVPPDGAGRVDLSYLPDVIGSVEKVIDLSLSGIIRFCEPRMFLPSAALERYKSLLTGNLTATLRALRDAQDDKKGAPLTEIDIQAAALQAAAPELTGGVLSRKVRQGTEGLLQLLFTPLASPEAEALLRRYLANVLANNPRLTAWFQAERDDIALVTYAALILKALNKPVTAFNIRGLGVDRQCSETLLPEMADVAAIMKKDPKLAEQACKLAETGLPRYAEHRLLDAAAESAVPLHSLVEELPGRLGRQLLRRQFLSALKSDILPDWVVECEQIWKPSTQERSVDPVRELVALTASIEARLRQQTSAIGSIESLAESYVDSGAATLEYDLWKANVVASQTQDRELLAAWDDVRPRLRKRIRERLLELDSTLDDLIGRNAQAFLDNKRTVAHVVPDMLTRPSNAPPNVHRLWFIVFDGMRWDMWERVVRPALEAHFTVSLVSPYLAMVPSTTKVSRTSLFAAQPPDNWKGIQGTYTEAEDSLAANTFGLMPATWRSQLSLISRTEDRQDEVRGVMAADERRLYTLLIFNISDDWTHHEQADPYQFGRMFATLLDTVLPSLRMLVDDRDIILVSSDHGFLELSPEDAVEVASDLHESSQGRGVGNVGDISYRYTRSVPVEGAVQIPFKHLGTYYVATRHDWFCRPGGTYTRYAHGGISLSELVVPAAVLVKRPVDKHPLVLRWQKIPQSLVLCEDEPGTVELVLSYDGDEAVRFTLRSTLSEVSPSRGSIQPGAALQVTLDVSPELEGGVVRVCGEGNTNSGQPVQVEEAEFEVTRTLRSDKVQVDTSALDLLEDKKGRSD